MTKARLKRALRRAVDLETKRSISSDELMGMGQDEYQVSRGSATRARLDHQLPRRLWCRADPRCGLSGSRPLRATP